MYVLLPWYADKFLADKIKNAMQMHGVFFATCLRLSPPQKPVPICVRNKRLTTMMVLIR